MVFHTGVGSRTDTDEKEGRCLKPGLGDRVSRKNIVQKEELRVYEFCSLWFS